MQLIHGQTLAQLICALTRLQSGIEPLAGNSVATVPLLADQPAEESSGGNAGGNLTTDFPRPGNDARNSSGVLLLADFRPGQATQDPIRFAAIIDGLSNTLLVGESPRGGTTRQPCRSCDRFYHYHPECDEGRLHDYSECLGSTYYPINYAFSPDRSFLAWPNWTIGKELAFGSFHSGGCIVSLADASTRFVAETVDINVWRAVGSRDGAEVMGDW